MANVTKTFVKSLDDATATIHLITAVTVPAGKLAVLRFGFQSDTVTISSVSDDAGNTWSVAGSVHSVSGDSQTCAIAYLVVPAGGLNNNTITVTLSATATLAADVTYYDSDTGWPAQASVLDKFAGNNNGLVTSWTSGNTATTTQADELLVGAAYAGGAINGGTSTASGGWTEETEYALTHGYRFVTEWQHVTATGAYAATGTWSAAEIAACTIATFKTAAGAAVDLSVPRPRNPLLDMLRTPGRMRTFAMQIITRGRADSAPTAAPTFVTDTDVGSGADDSVLTAVIPATDAGSGSETSALTAVEAASDTGTGSDASALAAAEAGTDAGSGTDAGAVAQSYVGTDTGSGSDASALLAAIPGGDAGSSSESGALTGGIPGSDVGSGSDASALLAAIPASDSGSGTDSGVLQQYFVGSDSGSGSDTATVALSLTSTDTGSGTQTGVLVTAIPGADSGTGTDTGVITAKALFVSDSGSGAESAALLAILVASDNGAGTDVGSRQAFNTGSDSGSGSESARIALAGADAGTGAEAAAMSAVMTGAELLIANDIAATLVSQLGVDAGTATELAIVTLGRLLGTIRTGRIDRATVGGIDLPIEGDIDEATPGQVTEPWPS